MEEPSITFNVYFIETFPKKHCTSYWCRAACWLGVIWTLYQQLYHWAYTILWLIVLPASFVVNHALFRWILVPVNRAILVEIISLNVGCHKIMNLIPPCMKYKLFWIGTKYWLFESILNMNFFESILNINCRLCILGWVENIKNHNFL